ncbi:hypothetical protein ThrDRAFT_02829 [Frankia casuarinae]|uniref:hypothetical protein n=1 Tax=Frankia TaxID=1854 RepID=UPI000449D977|nr:MULTISPECIES: hypothetical protein [Frankia]EYT91494.1 hypothetical protein ThrDRAFT_02829 [Frankia casuarinae]KDA41217.1 hypothetical protein BMG523Draft_03951 [Frankia sp. BMG5.23]
MTVAMTWVMTVVMTFSMRVVAAMTWVMTVAMTWWMLPVRIVGSHVERHVFGFGW